MASRADELIKTYDLLPLEGEGGYFTYLNTFGSNAGCILYLITENSYSSLHRLTEDEMWFFLEGDPCSQLVIDDVRSEKRILSSDSRCSLVKGGSVQATRLIPGGSYALFSTVMSPRYRDEIFSVPDDEFIALYPECREFLSK